jgi:hypothetical protein
MHASLVKPPAETDPSLNKDDAVDEGMVFEKIAPVVVDPEAAKLAAALCFVPPCPSGPVLALESAGDLDGLVALTSMAATGNAAWRLPFASLQLNAISLPSGGRTLFFFFCVHSPP